uniref:Uncharacterized protein n=1 Tax=Rhizophora mucronata TaxID=61149 RepID=A0A2P2PBK2_RHIMU
MPVYSLLSQGNHSDLARVRPVVEQVFSDDFRF